MTDGFRIYDPESLLTGTELASGFTYSNSHREWKDVRDFQAAVKGEMSTQQILEKGPRVRN